MYIIRHVSVSRQRVRDHRNTNQETSRLIAGPIPPSADGEVMHIMFTRHWIQFLQ